MVHIIEHMDPADALAILDRAVSALSDTGRLLIVTPNISHPTVQVNFWLDVTHVRPYPELLLNAFVATLGFPSFQSGSMAGGLETWVPGRACRTVAVGGGKLGVGTSTVAALMGLAAAACGQETLLVEGDGEPHSLASLFGVRGAPDFGVRGAPSPLRVRERLSLLRAEAAGMPPMGWSTEVLHDRFDLVVVDSGWRMDTVLDACAGEVERVLVVTTPFRAALSASYGLIKAVDTRFPGTRFELLVNQQEGSPARRTFEALQTAAMTFLRRGITRAGAVPEDACLRAGTRGGMSIDDAASGSEVAAAIDETTGRMLGELNTRRMIPLEPRHLLRGA